MIALETTLVDFFFFLFCLFGCVVVVVVWLVVFPSTVVKGNMGTITLKFHVTSTTVASSRILTSAKLGKFGPTICLVLAVVESNLYWEYRVLVTSHFILQVFVTKCDINIAVL